MSKPGSALTATTPRKSSSTGWPVMRSVTPISLDIYNKGVTVGSMNSTSVSHSASGEYYENGHMYSASSGCVSMTIREDGLVRYEHHYYANLGNMVQELDRAEYLKMLASIIAAEGTKHPSHDCTMKVYVSVTRKENVYADDWTKQEAAVKNMGKRERRRAMLAHVW